MKRTSLRLAALLTALLMLLSTAPAALAVDNDSTRNLPGCTNEDAVIRNNGNHFCFAEVSDPTCVESGTVWWYCVYCDEMVLEETLPALGHDWSGEKVLQEPTCTTDGQAYRICNRCGLEDYRTIPALGHDWQPAGNDSATCTEGGLQSYYCRRCQAVKEENTPALGHLWDGGTVTKQPTVDEEGVLTYTCQRDPSHTKTESIPKLNPQPPTNPPPTNPPPVTNPPTHEHQWGDWFVEEKGNCVKKALLRRVCSCGAEEYKYGDYGDHDWGEWQRVKEPGPGVEGLERRICKIESSHVEEKTIPATGPAEPPNPSLSLVLQITPGEEQAVYHDNDNIYLQTIITNTGNVPLYYPNYFSLPSGSLIGMYTAVLAPGESATANHIHTVYDNNGGSWAGGRVAVAFTDPNDAGQYDSISAAQSRASAVTSNEDWVTVVLTPDVAEDGHGLLMECLNGPESGIGKRVEGAVLPLQLRFTNNGSVPVRLPLPPIVYNVNAPSGMEDGAYRLEPGQSLTCTTDWIVGASEVTQGYATDPSYLSVGYGYLSAGGEWLTDGTGTTVQIPLTYPDGTVPEEAHPQLTLIYEGDSDVNYNPVTKEVLDFDDCVWADYTCINSGNVPLKLSLRVNSGGSVEWYDKEKVYYPSESLGVLGVGYSPVGSYLKTGTETAELAGTATVSFYFVGLDPVTGAELCQSNEINRTWKVAKPGPEPWPIPNESAMTITQFEDSYSSDPNGYVLGEPYEVWAVVENVGCEPVDGHTVYFPREDKTDSFPGTMEPADILWWNVGCSTVTEADVALGYIYFPPLILTWTDPISGNEISVMSEPVKLDVIDDPGLVLVKTIKNLPERGHFIAGETIQWQVSITNNSKETFTTVTVYDKGEQIGYFEEIAPGDTKTVDVPDYLVDEYDESIGEACNTATASAYDEDADWHMYFSNESKAPCGPWSPIPPVVPPADPEPKPHEDPLVPAVEEHVGAMVIKTELSYPSQGDYYVAGDKIQYEILVKNTGSVDLDTLTIYDSLAGLAPIATGGVLPAGQETTFNYEYTVTVPDTVYGWVYNTAVLEFTFGGMKGTPVTSNTVQSKVSPEAPHTTGGGTIDKDKLPDPPGKTGEPVKMPDGTPVTTPDGTPIIAPPGTKPVLDPDGKLVTTDEGIPVLKLPDGSYCIPDPDGNLIKTDKDGNPIYTEKGSYIYVEYSAGPISCEVRLKALGEAEGQYTLHACAAHAATAKAAEDAAAAGTADGWKQAGNLWREEIDKLYQALYDAADGAAKAAVVNDRSVFYTYVSEYETMMSVGDPAAAQKAVTELLRMHCAELCAMVHTVPKPLPDSMTGNYRRLMNSQAADANRRTLGALKGSDSELTEAYDANGARALSQVQSLLSSAKSSAAKVNAFTQAQRSWQTALDQVVNTRYRAADRATRKTIAACRIMLDQVYAARKELVEALYGDAPEVGAEALSNLYKNALFNMSK